MKLVRFFLALLCLSSLSAEELQPRRQLLNTSQPRSPAPVAQSTEAALLSSNFRVTLSATQGGKALGEISSLTCSPRLGFEGALSAEAFPQTCNLAGMMKEDQGKLLVDYILSATVPVQEPNKSVSYAQHTSNGTLRMEPKVAYEVLRMGGVIYSLTIAPEP
jgi:hypothetical protein